MNQKKKSIIEGEARKRQRKNNDIDLTKRNTVREEALTLHLEMSDAF
jgi:hypothetical protein